jgi:hypothetical protein
LKERCKPFFDRDTCALCGALDGQVFKMSEYEVGITAPPFHPWCRCCTAPYFEDMEGVGERFARDTVTGESFKVPGSMTYADWKAQQDKLYGAGTVDLEQKKSYNYSLCDYKPGHRYADTDESTQRREKIVMNVTDEQKRLLLEHMPEAQRSFDNDDIDQLLEDLDAKITEIGFDADYELNDIGLKLQKLYDELFDQN